jgi:hypothetical protein
LYDDSLVSLQEESLLRRARLPGDASHTGHIRQVPVSTQLPPATERPLAAQPASQASGPAMPAARRGAGALVPWAAVLLAPLVGVLLLEAPLINQLTFLDPWLYSGYGWTLSHHVAIFGWPYYADRFTVILPIAVSTGLLGPVPAYLILRYLLMAGCGALLYKAVRRFGSVPVAVAAVYLLMLNPFFVRLMLWDYTPFVTLPCTIAGVALWYLGSTRARAFWTAGGAGICMGGVIFANPFMGLVLPALLGVEAIAAIRGGRRDLITFVLRVCAMVAGALLVLVVGYLGYRAYLGSFSLKLLFQGTIDLIRSSSQTAATYRVSPSVFLRTQPHLYAPLLVCVGTVMILGRGLLSTTPRARMAQFAIAYTLAFWVYRLAFNSDVVELWFYYNMTAVTGAFAMPAILDEVGRRRGRISWLVVAGVAVVATAVTDFVIRSRDQFALNSLHTHTVVLVLVLVACCIAAALAAVLRQNAARLIAVAAFCAIVATIALAPDLNNTTGAFSGVGTTAEIEGYRAGYDITQLVAKYDRPSSRVLLWDDLQGLGDAGWVNLGGHIDTYTPPPIPTLTPTELVMLRDPTTTRVLAVSQNVTQIANAAPALEKHGFHPGLESEGVWTGGRLYYALIKLHAY